MNPAALGGGMPMGNMPSKKKEEKIPKLIQNDTKNKFYKFINKTYQLFFIVNTFVRKLLWFGSCIAFMYIMPMSFEVFTEQQKIL